MDDIHLVVYGYSMELWRRTGTGIGVKAGLLLLLQEWTNTNPLNGNNYAFIQSKDSKKEQLAITKPNVPHPSSNPPPS